MQNFPGGTQPNLLGININNLNLKLAYYTRGMMTNQPIMGVNFPNMPTLPYDMSNIGNIQNLTNINTNRQNIIYPKDIFPVNTQTEESSLYELKKEEELRVEVGPKETIKIIVNYGKLNF